MYIWKLREVVAAEGSPAEIIAKAKRASLSALWVKVADGTSRYANVGELVAPDLQELIRLAHDNGIEIGAGRSLIARRRPLRRKRRSCSAISSRSSNSTA